MAELFDISTNETGAKNAEGIAIKGVDTDEYSRFFRGGGLDALKQVLPQKIEPNTVHHFVSKGDWSLWELVEYLLGGIDSAELFFSTWSISELSARKLVEWLDEGKLTGLHAVLDYRARNRHPEAFHLAKHNIADLRVTNCHAKVAVLVHSGGILSVVGSANWTENPRIEAGMISAIESTGKMHLQWIKEVLKNGSYEF